MAYLLLWHQDTWWTGIGQTEQDVSAVLQLPTMNFDWVSISHSVITQEVIWLSIYVFISTWGSVAGREPGEFPAKLPVPSNLHLPSPPCSPMPSGSGVCFPGASLLAESTGTSSTNQMLLTYASAKFWGQRDVAVTYQLLRSWERPMTSLDLNHIVAKLSRTPILQECTG